MRPVAVHLVGKVRKIVRVGKYLLEVNITRHPCLSQSVGTRPPATSAEAAAAVGPVWVAEHLTSGATTEESLRRLYALALLFRENKRNIVEGMSASSRALRRINQNQSATVNWFCNVWRSLVRPPSCFLAGFAQ